MAGNEESLTSHEFEERDSPFSVWERGVTVGGFRGARGRKSVISVSVGSSWSLGANPFPKLLIHKLREMERIRGEF